MFVDKFDNKFICFSSNSGGFTSHWDWSVKMARYNKATYRNYAYELGIWSKRRGWELYSFWVWYMDKNRSLSDGNLFDEYREKDFKCRKSEGFPKPLYYSQIPTPKATLKQQKGA